MLKTVLCVLQDIQKHGYVTMCTATIVTARCHQLYSFNKSVAFISLLNTNFTSLNLCFKSFKMIKILTQVPNWKGNAILTKYSCCSILDFCKEIFKLLSVLCGIFITKLMKKNALKSIFFLRIYWYLCENFFNLQETVEKRSTGDSQSSEVTSYEDDNDVDKRVFRY